MISLEGVRQENEAVPRDLLAQLCERGPSLRFRSSGAKRHHSVDRPLRDMRLNLRLFAASRRSLDPATRRASTSIARVDWSELGPAQGTLMREVCDRAQQSVEAFCQCASSEIVEVMFSAMLPGQYLDRHTDDPEFIWGTRSQFPEWLSVAMLWSGQFDGLRVPIVTANCYLSGEGNLVIESGQPTLQVDPRAAASSGSLCIFDADSVIHSVAEVPARPGYVLGTDPVEEMLVDTERVVVKVDGGRVDLAPEAVRVSLHMKFLCFESAEVRARYESSRIRGISSLVQRQQACMNLLGAGLAPSERDYGQLGAEIIRTYVLPAFAGLTG